MPARAAAMFSLFAIVHILLSRAVLGLTDDEHNLVAASIGVGDESLPPTSTAHLPADVLAPPRQPSIATTSYTLSTGAVADEVSPTVAPSERSLPIPSSFPRPSTLPMDETASLLPNAYSLVSANDYETVRKIAEHKVEKKPSPPATAHFTHHITPRRAGTTVMRGIQAASIMTHAPPLQSCHVGQRFIVNHILFICHQFGRNRRGFRPFGEEGSERCRR